MLTGKISYNVHELFVCGGHMSINHEYYMGADLSAHVGKWIAICNNQILSEGDDPKAVFYNAQKKCGKNKNRILLTKVPKESTMIF
ncbi:MAG: DUF5678 domain-containing protein [Candidatus Altiarchaeota archaeon]